jgi:hypothetical protein
MQMLDAALNKGKKPPIIADAIQVVELEMGMQVSAWILLLQGANSFMYSHLSWKPAI